MPVSNSSFRIVCGQFYWTFQGFMYRRVQNIISKQVCKLKIAWPLSFVQTLAIVVLCTTVCMYDDTVHSQTQTGCSDDNFALYQDMIASRNWIFQLAVLTRFRKKDPPCYLLHLSFSLSRLWYGLLRMSSVWICVFLLLGLLICGDIESNPGPGYGIGTSSLEPTNDMVFRPRHDESIGYHYQRENNQHDTFSILERFRVDVSHTLNESLKRMETNSQQQGKNIEARLKRVEEKIDRRLHEVECKQAELTSKMEDLQTKHRTLHTENQFLKDTATYLTNKCEYLENEGKRKNLIFSGFPVLKGIFETWTESESKVKDIIKEGMGITDEIDIERAQRHGQTITVMFSSFKQKTMILANARKLKDSTMYSNIFVREDFSETVQEKRRMLLPIQQEMRQRGVKANLRFDKLVTHNSTFTYDCTTGQIKKWKRYTQPSSRPVRTIVSGNEGHDHGDSESASGAISQQHDHTTSGRLLHSADFPPLQTAGTNPIYPLPAHITNPNPNPQPQQPFLTSSQNETEDHQRVIPAISQKKSNREDPQNRSRTSQRPASQYNLRTRGNAADNGSSNGTVGSPKAASTLARDTGRRRSLSPPASNQRRIDSMFAASQVSPSSSQSVLSYPENDTVVSPGQNVQMVQEDDAEVTAMKEVASNTWS